MTIVTKQLSINTKREGDILDITDRVSEAVVKTKLQKGIVTVFVSGSTGALTTLENEPGLLKDFPAMLERIAPRNLGYEHERRWQDGNGHSHVKASLVGPSLTIPFVNGRLTLGTWQQIIFIELDVKSRVRTLVIQIMGE